eukprot:12943830-Heterocapsa_arctica.AAC.1
MQSVCAARKSTIDRTRLFEALQAVLVLKKSAVALGRRNGPRALRRARADDAGPGTAQNATRTIAGS